MSSSSSSSTDPPPANSHSTASKLSCARQHPCLLSQPDVGGQSSRHRQAPAMCIPLSARSCTDVHPCAWLVPSAVMLVQLRWPGVP